MFFLALDIFAYMTLLFNQFTNITFIIVETRALNVWVCTSCRISAVSDNCFKRLKLVQFHNYRMGFVFIKLILVLYISDQHGHSASGYPCQVCGKVLTTKSNRSIHMKIHTGEKPHVCSVCKKGFPYKSHLRSHMASHLTIKF